VQISPAPRAWDYALLSIGRQFIHDAQSKVILGRNARENDVLVRMAGRADAPPVTLLTPDNFNGPTAICIGAPQVDFAIGLMVRHTRDPRAASGRVAVRRGDFTETIELNPK
jgi:hypothetical protein